MEYTITEVRADRPALSAAVDALLQREGIERDANLDYTCAVLDEDGAVAATGSCFGNTLRCFAVDRARQGEGLMNLLISHLISFQLDRGYVHLFIYTKTETAKFFRDLGFYPIAEAPGRVCFLENRKNGFDSFLKSLRRESGDLPAGGGAGAVVMNANPFTLGHRYLVEQAAPRCGALHLFVVSEDASLVPFSVRRELVRRGVAHLKNVVLHETGPYLISSATFPSYFLKDAELVSRSHAELDAAVFARIADALGVGCRFLGDEPVSRVTSLYNEVLAERLPAHGIKCEILPRKRAGDRPISASTVRQLIHDGDWAALGDLLPETTLDYFRSPEASEVVRAIQGSDRLIHH